MMLLYLFLVFPSCKIKLRWCLAIQKIIELIIFVQRWFL